MKLVMNIAIVVMIFAIGISTAAAEQPTQWRQRKPAAAQTITTREDVEAEIQFGREVAARIIGRYRLYENPEVLRYVSLVGNAVAVNSGRSEIDFRFGVLNTDEINAYAAPGGYIFVTKGAVLKMQDEAELAGVLAHEMAHITEKHIVKELNIKGADDSAAAGLGQLIGGATDAARAAFSQAVDKALDILFKNGLKREDEAQADRNAVSFAALSGYDPAGFVRYLERIGQLKTKSIEVMDSTHPAFSQRISLLKEVMNQEGLDAAEGKNMKNRFDEVKKKIK